MRVILHTSRQRCAIDFQSKCFERSIAQHCREHKTRAGATDFSSKLHKKFTVINSRKRGQTFLVCQNVSPHFSQVINSTFSCEFHEKSTAPARVFYVGSAALSTSGQNVVITASTGSRHFERKSIVQQCRHQKTLDFLWKLQENLPLITREKQGQTFRDRSVFRFSRVINATFSCK